MKQTLKIGITALVIAAMAMSGIALAQTDDRADDVQQNAVTRIAEALQELVDNGTLEADQAQAVAEFLAENAPRRGPRGHRAAHGLAAVAEFLGMERDAFREALQEYDTLADLAAANGSSGDELIEYLIGKAEDRIDQAVADGRLTQEEGDQRLAEVTERITEKVNSAIPEPGQGGGRGPGGGGGFGGPPPVDTGVDA